MTVSNRQRVGGLSSTKPSAAELLRSLTTRGQEQPQWYDRAIEFHRRHREFEASQKAKTDAERRKAELEAMSTPDLLRAELAKQSTASNTMPLNGTQVLNAALAGGTGTINASAADLLRRGLMSVQDGRSE